MLQRLFTIREFTGYHMAAVIVLFFGTIISVNVTMAIFAATSWTGLVVENSYVESQHFNEHTAQRMEGLARGWQAEINYVDGTLMVDLADSQARPVTGVEVTMRIGRPSHEGEDQVLTLIETTSGRYSAETSLEPGIWSGEVTANEGQKAPWIKATRLYVKAD